ncbi:MAG: hypothetical protein KME05_06600 [Gloeocapsa sp. UFS-A4-WI-NPMV-4B04]|jgi:hypothetical protein|nr:hypothetical protein [Gloeocapsa sp. UFS-A4-WI-NPMV-4B04]
MKARLINYCIKQPQQIIYALVLTGILSLSSGLTLLQTATAASSKASGEAEKGEMVSKGKLISDRGRDDDRGRDRDRGHDDAQDDARGHDDDRVVLPSSVANVIVEDLFSKVGIPAGELKVIKYSRETWTDGCLGLGTLVEQCLQVQVEGWRVTLSNGRFSWVYRTDLQGLVLRSENQIAANLPPAVGDAVLQAASKQSELPISELRIIGAEQRSWPDGCLGLTPPDTFCTAVVVDGWLVRVEAGQQRLVYRTNADGSQITLDTEASTIKPVPIPTSELPPRLQEDVIFRAIAFGGFAGQTYETNLFEDGRVVRVLVNRDGTTSESQTKQISEQQVEQFKKLVKQEFEQFNNLSYPAPSGAADYITYTLTSRDEDTTRYTDINQDRLPSSLQTVIQAWNQIVAVE